MTTDALSPDGHPTADLPVRALSIRQPWADLILDGHKPVENRTWGTSWRGLLVIHAGLRRDPFGYEVAAQHGIPVDRTSPGGYLGLAELVDVHRAVGGCCAPWGEPGVHHWRLSEPRRFAHPVPGPGRLGLYTVAPSLTDLLEAL